MSGYLHVFMTGTCEDDESDGPHQGYIDPRYSWTEFQDRNNAGTVLSIGLDHDDLTELVRDTVDQYLGEVSFNNGDGTLYGQNETQDMKTGFHWTYALHFVEKYWNNTLGHAEYKERPWYAVSDLFPEAGSEWDMNP